MRELIGLAQADQADTKTSYLLLWHGSIPVWTSGILFEALFNNGSKLSI
jgi:hypothetical protein